MSLCISGLVLHLISKGLTYNEYIYKWTGLIINVFTYNLTRIIIIII